MQSHPVDKLAVKKHDQAAAAPDGKHIEKRLVRNRRHVEETEQLRLYEVVSYLEGQIQQEHDEKYDVFVKRLLPRGTFVNSHYHYHWLQ